MKVSSDGVIVLHRGQVPVERVHYQQRVYQADCGTGN